MFHSKRARREKLAMTDDDNNNQMPGKKIAVAGVQIHYEKHGTGSKVVLLMPGGTGK